MSLTHWMQQNYDLALGQRTDDVLRIARNDGVKVRQACVLISAFSREMIRRQELAAKFRRRKEAA